MMEKVLDISISRDLLHSVRGFFIRVVTVSGVVLLCFELCIQKRQPFRSSKKHISSHLIIRTCPLPWYMGGGVAASRNHRSIFAASINMLHITRTTSPLLLRRLRVSCSC
ncbi:uncharacterized protein K444DRAFT_249692 [Hyaloscypha bicolor E]|uniref:Uncharacterized protein n=1 Tax=Hyaloscypha bicolor E TaxID=1095630 RepID=A0A2J6SML8_9HELO|nr:uncharacterized protein K444DRAFT_249692 [Hyaloscypha bicolor E]PMD52008.1 hypothetical protein K444DRAFT_249692 [Hyaloscypha bicolor E]